MNKTGYKWTTSERWVAVACCLMVVFGWWVPNDLIERSAALRAFCDFMAAFIPQIDRATELGGLTGGNANRAVYSVLWVVAIFTIPIFVWRKFKKVQRDGFEPEQRQTTWSFAFLMLTLGAAIALNGFFLYSMDTSLRIMHFAIVNRLGAGLFAPGFVFIPIVAFFALFLLAWGLLTGRIVIGDKK